MWVHINDGGVRSRMSGENDANEMCLWKNGGKPDELTMRLMRVLNMAREKLDDEQLQRMHESGKGCTRAEVWQYQWLRQDAEELGVD